MNLASPKISQIEKDKVFLNLDNDAKQDIISLSSRYRFSFQDLRQLSIIATDFYMWDNETVMECIEKFELSSNIPLNKKEVMSHIKGEWNKLKSSKIKYEEIDKLNNQRPKPRKIELNDQNNEVFGMCPVASEKTVCCNLMTIDAVQGCSSVSYTHLRAHDTDVDRVCRLLLETGKCFATTETGIPVSYTHLTLPTITEV